MAVQVTPYNPVSLTDIALKNRNFDAQEKQRGIANAQNQQRLKLSERQLDLAAKRQNMDATKFRAELLFDVGAKLGGAGAVSYLNEILEEPLPDNIVQRFGNQPAEFFQDPEKFGAPSAAVDSSGNSAFVQVGNRGTARTVEGFSPPPKSGESISINPDGSVNITRGPASTLSNSTSTSLEKDAISDTEILAQTRNVSSTFNPKYHTLEGRFGAAVTSAKSRLGQDVNPEDKAALQEFSDYRANAAILQSKVINQLAGAAVSESEAERINGFLINPGTGVFGLDGDDPISAEAKLKRYERNVSWALARKQWFLRNGIEATEENWNKYSLQEMPTIIKNRHQEIVSELSKQNPEMAAGEIQKRAIEVGKQEFGLL